MSLSIGCDIVSIGRIRRAQERYGPAFAERFLTAEEQRYCSARPDRIAARFAAKEAVAKALGTGFWRGGVRLRDIEILRETDAAPQVQLHGAVAAHFQRIGGQSIAVSLSHERGYALAFCTIERNQ